MSESLVRESAERLFADHATPAVVNAAEAGEWPTALWNAVSGAGFLDALGDTGGLDGLADAAAILQAAGRYGAPLPLAETMLARWLLRQGRLAVPDAPLALAVESAEQPLRLARAGAGWRLSASISELPWAAAAEAIVAIVGRQVALVPKPPELAARRSLAGEPGAALSLDLALPATAVGESAIDAAAVFRSGALLRAAQMAGALAAALQLAVTYANDRVQFGRPIGKFQAIQQELALAAEQVAAAGAAVGAAVVGAASGDLVFTAAAAKLRAGEAAGRVADIVHQVHGAIGFTHEHRLHHLTRRLWAWRDEFGHEAYWAQELGRLVAAQGPDGLWPFLAAR